MHTKKLVTGLALAALALAPTAQASQAASHSAHGVGRAAAAPPIIQGVVTDQFGHKVDDVEVDAVRANGNPAASALTYSNRNNGQPHGYFHLEVGGKGSFTLTLSKDGYVTEEIGPFDITRKKQRLSLGELELVKKLADTKTTGELKDDSITPTQKGKVDVTVSAKGAKPAGEIEIRDGRNVVGNDEMTAGDNGSITVTLKKLAKGSYNLKAYFLGSNTLKPSSSRSFTLEVKKPRHRPNAW